MSLESWLALWSLESLWWTFGIFFAAALVEMWFPPFPGDAVYFIGLWSMSAGDVSVYAAIGAALCGSFLGYVSLYWLGRARGRRLFMRDSGMWSEKSLRRMEGWFRRWGGWVIIFGRFIVGARSAVPLVAGVSLFPLTWALVFGGISIIIWNGILAVGALSLGHNWESVANILSTYNLAFWIIALAGLTAWGIWKLLKKNGEHTSK